MTNFPKVFCCLQSSVASPFGRTKLTPTAIVGDLRSQGFTSVRAIAAQLNEHAILTPRGAAWHPTSAARLLSRLDGKLKRIATRAEINEPHAVARSA